MQGGGVFETNDTEESLKCIADFPVVTQIPNGNARTISEGPQES